jgi:hypothetical protein
MYARTTQLEIDTVRVPLDAALEVYRSEVMPRLREQPGFCGVQVMSTPDGRALIITFWDREDGAGSLESDWYRDVLGQYATLFRSPPGRGWYEVLLTTPIDDRSTMSSS